MSNHGVLAQKTGCCIDTMMRCENNVFGKIIVPACWLANEEKGDGSMLHMHMTWFVVGKHGAQGLAETPIHGSQNFPLLTTDTGPNLKTSRRFQNLLRLCQLVELNGFMLVVPILLHGITDLFVGVASRL